MADVFNLQISERRQQAENSLRVQQLTQQLVKYNQLRRAEEELRGRTELLERQAAMQGPLRLDVDLAMLLKKEQRQLDDTRHELESQENELQKLESLPEEQRSLLAAGRLERTVSDIKVRREQIRIHQANIHFLEEKQANLGLDARLDLANELASIRKDLEKVQIELKDLKQRLQREWQIDPESIEGLDSMDEARIRALAMEAVSQKEERDRVTAAQRIEAAAREFDAMVMAVLEDLKGAVYPGPDYQTSRNFNPNSDFPTYPRPFVSLLDRAELEWKLTCVGTYQGVVISLMFDHDYRPARFSCQLLGVDGTALKTASSPLSRKDLVEALKELHMKEKSWWQFWYQPPIFPKSWTADSE